MSNKRGRKLVETPLVPRSERRIQPDTPEKESLARIALAMEAVDGTTLDQGLSVLASALMTMLAHDAPNADEAARVLRQFGTFLISQQDEVRAATDHHIEHHRLAAAHGAELPH